ncbi:tRNA lysidine(34) synthetase TilS [candidate division WOR-3 bacterium]|nr:tRNA lysidine(34) synthetase TilS [candidate division WOR-3 bacterium]
MSLIPKAKETLKRECGVKKGARIVVACSGGADSVALLHFLHTLKEKLGIAKLGVYHLNHGLRGAEADADQAFVADLARALDIPFHADRADVAAYAAQHGISLEMAGRKIRYARLERALESKGYTLAALGHTASDNAEWILLSLIRGRAEPFLWGIPAKRGPFIRPLIRCTRTEILAYLKKHRLSFREDSSNVSLSFDRNRIRHRIMPLLKKLNPSLEETISRTLEIGDVLNSSLDSEAAELLKRLVATKGKTRELDTSGLSSYNPVTQLRVLRLFAPWLGANDLLGLLPLEIAKGTREIARGEGKKLSASYDRLVLEDCKDQPLWEPRVLSEEKDVLVPGFGWRLRVYAGKPDEFVPRDDTVFFDASFIKPPFVVRPWREGDRIVPFGRRGEVKLKRVFSDRKVVRRLRRYWPLVCKDDEVVWAAGLIRCAAARVTSSTSELTILTLLRGEDDKQTA